MEPARGPPPRLRAVTQRDTLLRPARGVGTPQGRRTQPRVPRWDPAGRGSVSLALTHRPPGAVSRRAPHRRRWPRSALCPGHPLPAPFGKQRVCRWPPPPADVTVLASAALHAAAGAGAARPLASGGLLPGQGAHVRASDPVPTRPRCRLPTLPSARLTPRADLLAGPVPASPLLRGPHASEPAAVPGRPQAGRRAPRGVCRPSTCPTRGSGHGVTRG